MTPVRRAALACAHLAVLATLACRDTAHPSRGDALVARRLAGAWTLTLRLERPLSLSSDAARLPREVSGRMSLVESIGGRRSFVQMRDPTDVGVYAIDLPSLGLPELETGVIPAVAGRTSVHATPARSDSVHMVINPEIPTHALRLSGVFEGDSVRGTWIAESFLGGGGTFVLRRAVQAGSALP